jgi:type II secretory pathway component GspD/PulD (secretin)
MRLPMLLTTSILLLAGCTSTQAQKGAAPAVAVASDPFPAPNAGIQVAIADGVDMKLQKLLDEFSKVTGVALLMDQETRGDVQKSTTGLNRSIEVPASEVYSVVETILLQNGFFLVAVHDRDPKIASLVSINQGGNRSGVFRSSALLVSARDIEFYSRHPAVLVTTVLDLPHTDARTLSNSLRSMFTDANTQQIVPVGNSNTLIVTGFGSSVANIVRMLQVADEASARASAEDEKRRAERDARREGPPPKPDAPPKEPKPE